MQITRLFTEDNSTPIQTLITNTLSELIDLLAQEYYANNMMNSTTSSNKEDVQQ